MGVFILASSSQGHDHSHPLVLFLLRFLLEYHGNNFWKKDLVRAIPVSEEVPRVCPQHLLPIYLRVFRGKTSKPLAQEENRTGDEFKRVPRTLSSKCSYEKHFALYPFNGILPYSFGVYNTSHVNTLYISMNNICNSRRSH